MKNFITLAAFAALAFSVSGCGGLADGLVGNKNPRVRLVNAFPGTNIDASFTDSGGTQNIMADRPFATVTIEFVPNNGNNTVTFSGPAGGAEFISRSSLYELNRDYTVVGFGAAGSRNILTASEGASPLAGRAAFRVMNVSNGVVDVRTAASGAAIGASTMVRDNLGLASNFPYQDVAAGSMRIFITNSDGSVVHSADDYTFESGKTYTIIVAENAGTQVFKINSF